MIKDATWDTTPAVRLTENVSAEAFASVRPDGKMLVFDSNRLVDLNIEPLHIFDLYLMNLEDTDNLQHSVADDKQILVTRGSSATWSPDGKRIAFHASRSGIYSATTLARSDPGTPTLDSDIFVLQLDDCLDELVDCRAKQKAGQPGVVPDFLKNLTHDTSPTIIDEDPDWSPTGQQLVYVSHEGEVGDYTDTRPGSHKNTHAELWVINADGTGKQQLTFNSEEERAPAWSSDGKRIAFLCRTGDVTFFQICVIRMQADGTCVKTPEDKCLETQLTDNGKQHLGAEWSPDDNYMVTHRNVSPDGLQLFVISLNPDGTCKTEGALPAMCSEEQLTKPPPPGLPPPRSQRVCGVGRGPGPRPAPNRDADPHPHPHSYDYSNTHERANPDAYAYAYRHTNAVGAVGAAVAGGYSSCPTGGRSGSGSRGLLWGRKAGPSTTCATASQLIPPRDRSAASPVHG